MFREEIAAVIPGNTIHRTEVARRTAINLRQTNSEAQLCLLYTSDAADERSSVDLGGRRIIKKKKKKKFFFFFQAEDGIRDAQESRGLGDVYKRQPYGNQSTANKFGGTA